MFDKRYAFYATCIITSLVLIAAALLAYFAPDPTPQPIVRLLDALIYIAIAGALAIFGLLGYQTDKKPSEPG